MRFFRHFSVVLLLAAALWSPTAARAQSGQTPAATNQDQEYLDREDQERRDRARREQEALHEAPSCPECARRTEGIQTRSIPGTTLVVVLHDTDLDDGALTVRFRFYNDGPAPARLAIDPASAYESFYLEVGGEKLFILRDEDGDLAAKKPLELDLKPGKMESWWAKFPVPAADTETFDLEIPPVATFRDVPIDDD